MTFANEHTRKHIGASSTLFCIRINDKAKCFSMCPVLVKERLDSNKSTLHKRQSIALDVLDYNLLNIAHLS